MITVESLKSHQDTPDPLRLLCLKVIITKTVNLNRFTLPPEMGNLIAEAFRDFALVNRLSERSCVDFFKKFKHKYIPLSKIDFSGLQLTGEALLSFIEEYKDTLDEINISNTKTCHHMFYDTSSRLNSLLKHNLKQKSLIIGDAFSDLVTVTEIFDGLGCKKLVLHKRESISHTDKSHDEFNINRTLSEFLTLKMCQTLRYLDISMCSIGKGSALMHLEKCEILILYNCRMTYPDVITTICRLKKLRVLDISKHAIESDDSISNSTANAAEDPKLLDLLVSRLPDLSRLDISGTNLVGGKDRTISAFESRVENPFKFLGLFHTGNDAAYRSCIPAKAIAGEANETQMLNACEAYIDRPEQLSKALNDLYNFYKTITPSETFDDVNRALDVVLPILTKHLNNEQVIVFTTAALWCIVKINVTSKNLNDSKVRRTITSRLLDVMHYHQTNRIILINGGLTLLFLPDIICEHSRVAAISLHMCRDSDPRTQGFGTTLLNTLACQVGGDQKIFIGKLRAIETMIDIINAKIEENTCDEILETAWSTLWNITDETPVNCQRFLEFNGLVAFETCMDKFSSNKEVLRNMMGLLGNIAECERLRINFMQERYIRRFCSLLSSQIDGIECSYNACGILAHLVSNGIGFWESHLPNIPCSNVLKEMRSAILRWPINSRRNINYRSFEPIVRLLDPSFPHEAQYWAVFALTNLTRINPSKYCHMLVSDKGLKKLVALTEQGVTEPFVRDLARVAVYQYVRFEMEETLAGLEQSDSIDFEVVRNFRAESNAADDTSELGEVLI